jgi:hypothetical protein
MPFPKKSNDSHFGWKISSVEHEVEKNEHFVGNKRHVPFTPLEGWYKGVGFLASVPSMKGLK